ncbi:MAG: hypothetical protein F4Y61_02885 [Rhodothermaceae bacterium]|nr:hypothetical protein [Rhodothermaceae bacterium]MYF79852.1 hypothetical protein [Chloroflexota bacterium]
MRFIELDRWLIRAQFDPEDRGLPILKMGARFPETDLRVVALCPDFGRTGKLAGYLLLTPDGQKLRLQG